MGKYKLNDIVKGKVNKITDYGIFVDLEDDYKGLIHISEITSGYVKDINDYVEEGEIINSKIIDLDEDKKQLRLSLKIDINERENGNGFKTLKNNLNKWIEEERNSKIIK